MGRNSVKYILLGLALLSAAFFAAIRIIGENRSQGSGDSVSLPTKVQAISEEEVDKVTSSDGRKTLAMKSRRVGDQTEYSFYVDDSLLFIKLTRGKITLPFNAWSIDDKNFFLKEEVDGKENFYVEPNLKINLTEIFYNRFPNYKLQQVTGWAGPNLILVNANDGLKDVSFWFNIVDQSFTKLSNRFD